MHVYILSTRVAQSPMRDVHSMSPGPGPLRDPPEGDKEKHMLQGLLASKERVVTEVRQERLFG